MDNRSGCVNDELVTYIIYGKLHNSTATLISLVIDYLNFNLISAIELGITTIGIFRWIFQKGKNGGGAYTVIVNDIYKYPHKDTLHNSQNFQKPQTTKTEWYRTMLILGQQYHAIFPFPSHCSCISHSRYLLPLRVFKNSFRILGFAATKLPSMLLVFFCLGVFANGPRTRHSYLRTTIRTRCLYTPLPLHHCTLLTRSKYLLLSMRSFMTKPYFI